MVGGLNYTQQLEKQLGFLETSSREYDAGNLDEAIRIATALWVMFHYTTKSMSLLVHLGATSISMLSTAGKRVRNDPRGYWPALVHIDIDVAQKTVMARPTFNDRPSAHRMIPFSAWWDGEAIYAAAGHRIKRKALVLNAANKDGGAHVDNDIPPDYGFFLDGTSFSLTVESVEGSKTESYLVNAHLACLRQIAHEILNSPDLLKLAGR
jgi:hypothetical protein